MSARTLDSLGRSAGRQQVASVAMKDIGLVGVPFSGKSTLFTALTRAGAHGGQANQAVVPVPDPRLSVLTEMERSREDRRRAGAVRRRARRYVQRAGDREAARGRRAGGGGAVFRRRRDAGRRACERARGAVAGRPRGHRVRAREGREAREGKGLARGRRAPARARGAVEGDPAPRREARGGRRRTPAGDRAAHVEAVRGGGEPRGGDRGAGRAAGGRGGRVRLDRGRDRRDGPRGGAGAAGGVRRGRAGAGEGDRGVLPRARPHHVPHDRRGRDPRVGGAPRRPGARGRRA